MDIPVNTKRTRGSRSPVGVDMKHRLPVALFPEERKRLEAVAAADSRAVSAMARVLIMRGVEKIEKELGMKIDEHAQEVNP